MTPPRPGVPRSGRVWWIEAAEAVGRKPSLWWIAVVESVGFAPRGWWHRWPPIPVPAQEWLAFRMETAYGDESARPSPEDVVAWLDWCRRSRHHAGVR